MAAGNTFGTVLKLTLFGESHGVSVGGVLDGFPAGQTVDFDRIAYMLSLRSPGGNAHETARKEEDCVEFLSGLSGGLTLGSPLAFFIRNQNARPAEYENTKNIFRPGHADYAYYQKYGIPPQPGGGRSSGRETAARVVAGSLALDFLRTRNIDIVSYVSSIGAVSLSKNGLWYDEATINRSVLRCPEPETEAAMIGLLNHVTGESDSIGGKITTVVRGLPAGLGEPVFGKISSTLAQAALSIPGAKGVDFGAGFSGLALRGSEYNDPIRVKENTIVFSSNNSGGIQGGISNGNMLVMNTVFRPASSIGTRQQSVDMDGKETDVVVHGRHDACYVPRAAVVVTSMVAVAIMDEWLLNTINDQEC